MFNISISIEGSKVLGIIEVDSYFFEPFKYDYAFYLYKDSEKIDTVWYSRSMDVAFNLKEDTTGKYHIKAFIRDIDNRDIRSYRSGKISVDI